MRQGHCPLLLRPLTLTLALTLAQVSVCDKGIALSSAARSARRAAPRAPPSSSAAAAAAAAVDKAIAATSSGPLTRSTSL